MNKSEPVFILRGNDRLAHAVISYWLWLAEEGGVKRSKRQKAWLALKEFEWYQASHKTKTPD